PVPDSVAPEPTCSEASTALQAFFIAWNDRSPGTRADALGRCCAPQARFVDPRGTTEGTEALAASITEFRSRYPGAIVEFRSPDQHPCVLRVHWTTVLGDGTPELRGVDFVDLAPDGPLRPRRLLRRPAWRPALMAETELVGHATRAPLPLRSLTSSAIAAQASDQPTRSPP